MFLRSRAPPSQPRTAARKAGVPDPRQQLWQRNGLSAGAKRIRTVGPTCEAVISPRPSAQTRDDESEMLRDVRRCFPPSKGGRTMSTVQPFPAGGYRFIGHQFQYSGGVAAEPGFRIERARFTRPVPLAEGFDAIEAYF